jgi:flagellar motor switch protein FliG
MKDQIKAILSQLHPSEAIALLESLGKEFRKKNSIRINNLKFNKLDMERPDLLQLKSK